MRCSVLTLKSGLPGADGSNTEPNVVAAGIIIVQIGNFLIMLLSALFDTESAAQLGSGASTPDSKV